VVEVLDVVLGGELVDVVVVGATVLVVGAAEARADAGAEAAGTVTVLHPSRALKPVPATLMA
jgi:hypothetical protein